MADPGPQDRATTLRAVGALLWKDPGLVLGLAAGLRGSDATIECTLRGGSMEPAIPAGSAVRIQVGRTPPYRAGEVIAFFRADGLCVHRVRHCGRGPRSSGYLVTQGDACFVPDEPVESTRILGAVSEFRMGEAWISVADRGDRGRARSAWGRLLSGLAAALLEVRPRLARFAMRVARLRPDGPARG